MSKKFIITIDTEGDNLWQWRNGLKITTNNSKYIPRFQELCDKYQFKPTYLTNYEMLHDDFFFEFAKYTLEGERCEIGMHLHAWNSPPLYTGLEYSSSYGAPYLIEYPDLVMEEKIKVMTSELESAFCRKMLSHRAGRWATNSKYYDLLIKYGYKYDCSVTPHVDWSHTPGGTTGSKGSNYLYAKEKPYKVFSSETDSHLTEVPVTIRRVHAYIPKNNSIKSLIKSIYHSVSGKTLWLRPDNGNIKDLLYLVDLITESGDDYLMFMLHSSELMPSGSPSFKNRYDIDCLYDTLDVLFEKIHRNFNGITLDCYEC